MALLEPERVDIVTDPQFKIPSGPLKPFDPLQIVYRELTFNCSLMRYEYSYYDLPTKHDGADNFYKLLKLIGKGKYPKNKDEPKKESKALDVKISRDSYIVIGLAKNTKWTFSEVNPAVTLGKPPNTMAPHLEFYADVTYVDDEGNTYSELKAGCRVAFFSAKKVSDNYTQPLNFNIVTQDGTAVVVDPDIRFPGNGSS